jgi:hypothetical protein
MTNKNFTFSNQNCSFSFNLETKEISGSDHTDQWNMPRCYNQNTRSIKKALESVTKSFNDNPTPAMGRLTICLMHHKPLPKGGQM